MLGHSGHFLKLSHFRKPSPLFAITGDFKAMPLESWNPYAALQWLHDEAANLGVNPNGIAVMGESAGGGHAALLALKARGIGKIPLVAQILTYPILDDRTGTGA